MRLHVPALKGQEVLRSNSTCAYTQKIWKFAKMMTARGHEVIVYGHATGSDASATEYVPCYPDPCVWTGSWAREDWTEANLCAAAAIAPRRQEGDILCLITSAQQQISESLPEMPVVEWGIGYGGTFARHRVFESYAWMHTVFGSQHGFDSDGHFYSCVIPNFFDPEDFEVGLEPEGYLLFLGRVMERKGVEVAEATARKTGRELIIAGADEGWVVEHGTVLGPVGPEQRAELLSHARAVLVPTLYIEPFGGVAVEAQMSGSPVLCTDWGAMTETVIDGVTGYRCHTEGEFAWAAEAGVERLDRAEIAELARRRYSLEAIAPLYERYFQQVLALHAGQAFDSDWEGLSRLWPVPERLP